MSAWWSWVLTAFGVFGIYLTTRKLWAGYAVGLAAQTLWVTYAITTRQWGFIASAAAYGSVYALGWYRWTRPDAPAEDNMNDLSTLDGWNAHVAERLKDNPRYFDFYPLRAMRQRNTGRYQYGYEIGGYGTVVGHCVHHTHKTAAGADECGARFVAGLPARRWRRR